MYERSKDKPTWFACFRQEEGSEGCLHPELIEDGDGKGFYESLEDVLARAPEEWSYQGTDQPYEVKRQQRLDRLNEKYNSNGDEDFDAEEALEHLEQREDDYNEMWR